MDPIKEYRYFVYQTFVKTGHAPLLEDFMQRYQVSRDAAKKIVEDLHQNHKILKIPNTHCIMMSWPFSNIPTPHRAKIEGQDITYYANCAWDIMGIHCALQKPVLAISSCHQTGKRITFQLDHGKVQNLDPSSVVIAFALPYEDWYHNLIET